MWEGHKNQKKKNHMTHTDAKQEDKVTEESKKDQSVEKDAQIKELLKLVEDLKNKNSSLE